MQGDFTRDTFNASKHYSRVLMQQGRVQIDADWNEQAAIHTHYLRALARDLIGPHGGPSVPLGFAIAADANDPKKLAVGPGHYYVNGILLELGAPISHEEKFEASPYLFYLEVWERAVSSLIDDSLREVALGGPDTCVRAQIVWRLRSLKLDKEPQKDFDPEDSLAKALGLTGLALLTTGKLRARASHSRPDDTPCLISPDSRFRGAENQLYRVEIHDGGKAGEATFKWSRENASVAFSITRIADRVVTLQQRGRDDRLSLAANDWVEIVDDDTAVLSGPPALSQIQSLGPETPQVTLHAAPAGTAGHDPDKHPILRRWDQKANAAVELKKGLMVVHEDAKSWINIENGVQVQFPPPDAGAPANVYQSGDYWLIPARVATGDVEWPGTPDDRTALPPRGVGRYFAPLASAIFAEGKLTGAITDYRKKFDGLAKRA